VAGKRWIFVDLALSADEQLEQFIEALQEDPALFTVKMPDDVAEVLGLRRAA
jgi:hypothetical protein